jgi:diguanylate cyclase (GGDEF)-like protein/PAS domain S-box-containing protein
MDALRTTRHRQARVRRMRNPAEDRFQRIVEGLSALAAPNATPPPLDELLERVVAQAQDAAHAGGAVLELVEGADLLAIAASGSLAARGGHRRSTGSGLSGRAIAAQALQHCGDTWADPAGGRRARSRIGARSVMAAPLVYRGAAIGVLKVVAAAPDAFDAIDMHAVTLYAALVGGQLGRQREAAATRAAAERVQRLIASSPDAFISIDESLTILEWNASAEALFGWSREEMLGRPLAPLVAIEGDAWADPQAAVQRYVETGQSKVMGRRIEGIAQRRDGSRLPVELVLNSSRSEGRILFDAFIRDVSENRALVENLRLQALQDELTGLPNRAGFNRVLDAEFVPGTPSAGLGLVFLDLDGFKQVNDSRGHGAGDAVLREVALRLQGCVRQSDTVARLAGDEFVILLRGMADAQAAIAGILDTIVAACRHPVAVDGVACHVSASLGVALRGSDDTCAADLVHRADGAMYLAKKRGGDGWCVADTSIWSSER